MKKAKKIMIAALITIGFFFIISVDGLTDKFYPKSKILIDATIASTKNFENMTYIEIKQTIVDLYTSPDPEQWSKDNPDQFCRALEFLNDYSIWELKNPTSTAKNFFQQLATENQRRIVCLE